MISGLLTSLLLFNAASDFVMLTGRLSRVRFGASHVCEFPANAMSA
jgi:hypothetical protein